jgi:hypothetical protein
MPTKNEILDRFKLFRFGTAGIGAWLTDSTDSTVFDRLSRVDAEPLSKVQLNQLLVLGHEGSITDAFFKYYWLEAHTDHPYNVAKVAGFDPAWLTGTPTAIRTLDHLQWGLLRIYIDGLLYFGNVRTAFRVLRAMKAEELQAFFGARRFNTDAIARRGAPLPLFGIAKDDRYLISEMACKSYESAAAADPPLRTALIEAWREHEKRKGGRIAVRDLLDGTFARERYKTTHQMLLFSADNILEQQVASEAEIVERYTAVAETFNKARQAALQNTRRYLSMVNDLDVYVATSMRSREDFRAMATACEQIFTHDRLRDLNLRYFDPTMSAAEGHEDKGLIECLMVKCSKVLIYCAGKRESYGKDAEAAMALSLGKPVVFYCDEEGRRAFYRDVHPLSRLIDFGSGVAVGAIVSSDLAQVSELLFRIFGNLMEYDLVQHPDRAGFLRLEERLTKSVVRVQTSDALLIETFWNHYHNQQ